MKPWQAFLITLASIAAFIAIGWGIYAYYAPRIIEEVKETQTEIVEETDTIANETKNQEINE